MTALYLESSAALAWIHGEPQGEKVIALMDRADVVVSSFITPVELRRAILRRELQEEISPAVGRKLLGLFENRLPVWEIVGFSDEIERRAGARFPVEPIRSLDAIHLATALEASKIYADLRVASLDRRILQNLEPLGLPPAPLPA